MSTSLTLSGRRSLQSAAPMPPAMLAPLMPAPEASAPVWHFALSWIIVVPLLFFSANGILIPPTGDPSFAATGSDPSGSAFHMISVAGMLMLCSVLIASRWKSLLPMLGRTKVLLALPLLAMFSSVWSEQPLQSLTSGTILLVFTVFALYVSDRFSFREQIELIILVGSVALPLSIALALFVPSMGATEAGWRGIFGHKQNCAAVSTLWLVTALHWKGSGIYQKILRVAILFMSVALIIMSASRTGWVLALAAIAISAVIWVMQKLPAQESILVLLVVLALAAGVGYAVVNHSTDIVTAAGKDPTLSQRTIIWNAVWGEITKRPILGYGFNAFWKGLYGASQAVVLTSGWNVFQAQDGFLDVWLSVGLVGVALVVILVAQSMKNAVRSFRADNQTYVRWCIVVILCTLLYNIGESTIGVLSMSWFLFLLAAIGLKQAADNKNEFDYAFPLIGPQMSVAPTAGGNAR